MYILCSLANLRVLGKIGQGIVINMQVLSAPGKISRYQQHQHQGYLLEADNHREDRVGNLLKDAFMLPQTYTHTPEQAKIGRHKQDGHQKINQQAYRHQPAKLTQQLKIVDRDRNKTDEGRNKRQQDGHRLLDRQLLNRLLPAQPLEDTVVVLGHQMHVLGRADDNQKRGDDGGQHIDRYLHIRHERQGQHNTDGGR